MAQHLKGDLTPAQAEELVWLTLARLEKAHLLQEAVVKLAGRKLVTRRELLKGLGVTVALLPVITSIVAPGPVEAQSPVPTATATPIATPIPTVTPVPTVMPSPTPPTGSQTFDFTGAEQQFVVPAGVTAVTIQAFGAQGGTLANGVNASGEGGSVTATIPVTPGETLLSMSAVRGEMHRLVFLALAGLMVEVMAAMLPQLVSGPLAAGPRMCGRAVIRSTTGLWWPVVVVVVAS